jgi:hypothetical protein
MRFDPPARCCTETDRLPEATSRARRRWPRHGGKVIAALTGLAALIWFLVRVIPKPSRAAYPCQRAAFPLASGFVLWLAGSIAGVFAFDRLRRRINSRWLVASFTLLAIAGWSTWTIAIDGLAAEKAAKRVTLYNWEPQAPNQPIGVARGIFPGRVVWAHDPSATKWAGRWNLNDDQWWTDANTDQQKVDAMFSAALRNLTGTANDEKAWQAIFQYYQHRRGFAERGHQPGEIVAIKANLNNGTGKIKNANNYCDTAPQTILAVVRQLVNQAHIAPADIIVYDARRCIYPAVLNKVWAEFKDVRFVQEQPPMEDQPKNPAFGDYHGLEQADWVEGVSYSKGEHKDANLIPRQIMQATYIVNLAMLKAQSYPFDNMGKTGDQGQTAMTMCGKNHFGSIKGTRENHNSIDTDVDGTPHAYSPLVDLAAAPKLGAKTILFALDALYSGRKHQSYPLHFPNPPFNNRVSPYENPDWPSSVPVSLDGVAIDSVGLDIYHSQSKNNPDPTNQNRSRVLVRENADDYLHEMAQPEHAPSGTVYRQAGKPVTSLGVHEHWDADTTRRYSRNLDPAKGTGIELVYLPLSPKGATASTR